MKLRKREPTGVGTVRDEGSAVSLFVPSCRAIGLGLAVNFAACARPEPPPVYDCVIHVSSDPGEPLPNVPLSRDGTHVGSTDPSGNAKLRLQGVEGDTIFFKVECPQGFRQPAENVAVTLKSLSDRTRTPEYFAICAPDVRKIVVAIRAENGPNLPVMYLGQEVARTDSFGTAHVSLGLAPNSEFELTLATDEQAARQLRPQNPTAKFLVRDQDDVLPLAQRFTVEPLPKAKPRPKLAGPVRLK
jgi:hypothetical protein